jgi:hypothetical protein
MRTAVASFRTIFTAIQLYAQFHVPMKAGLRTPSYTIKGFASLVRTRRERSNHDCVDISSLMLFAAPKKHEKIFKAYVKL